MPLDLDRLQQRIVGVLVEKEKTVPDSYPLTINALVSGCNQKNNRDPQMSVEPYEVEGAMHALMDAGWVVRLELAGSRTARYEHRAREQLGVSDAEMAILAELLNRNGQAPGELKTRAGRMHSFASPAEVERLLQELAARPVPYVEQQPRLPREHAARWLHCLGERATEEETDEAVPAPAAPLPSPAARPATPSMAARVEALENDVAELRARLDRLDRTDRPDDGSVTRDPA